MINDHLVRRPVHSPLVYVRQFPSLLICASYLVSNLQLAD
jgi:hypothetical protein